MHVTIIGTGNMARGIGRRVLEGGHRLTVVGKDAERAEAVLGDLREQGADGEASTAVAGDPVEGEVVVLAVYYPDAREAVEQNRDASPGRRSSTSPTRSTTASTGSSCRRTARPRSSSPSSLRTHASSRPSTRRSPAR